LSCRSAPPEDKWWTPQLSPEDLVEPTGHGAGEMDAIRDALVRDLFEPIWLAAQEIVATRGDLFRCRCFHAGIVYVRKQERENNLACCVEFQHT
jgi:hypothetical protein